MHNRKWYLCEYLSFQKCDSKYFQCHECWKFAHISLYKPKIGDFSFHIRFVAILHCFILCVGLLSLWMLLASLCLMHSFDNNSSVFVCQINCLCLGLKWEWHCNFLLRWLRDILSHEYNTCSSELFMLLKKKNINLVKSNTFSILINSSFYVYMCATTIIWSNFCFNFRLVVFLQKFYGDLTLCISVEYRFYWISIRDTVNSLHVFSVVFGAFYYNSS